MNIEKNVMQNIEKLNSTSGDWLVAYSGGVDSRVMLDILYKLKPSGKNLVMLHVNHGLSDNATEWEDKAKTIADHYGIEIRIAHLNMKDESAIEEVARTRRYEFFVNNIKENDIIFMGHHKNDNAETLLFRLFRSTGIKGLCGIPQSRKLGAGKLVRPMMNVSRKEIMDYAVNCKLDWVEDESNKDSKYSRNFIRNEVIPFLETKWPSVVNSITGIAQKAQDAEDLLEEIAQEDIKKIGSLWVNKHKQEFFALDMNLLRELSNARLKNVLLYWVRDIDDQNKGSKNFENLLSVVLTENKNNSKLRKVEFKNANLVSNGNKIWIEMK